MLTSMLKKLINAKTYNRTDIEKRLNTFFAFGQINEEEYGILMELVEQKY